MQLIFDYVTSTAKIMPQLETTDLFNSNDFPESHPLVFYTFVDLRWYGFLFCSSGVKL
jgi:hypothetical protein